MARPTLAAPPRLHHPTAGRRCRAYPSADMAAAYARGYLNPAGITPAACGRPEQQGALDRLMETPTP